MYYSAKTAFPNLSHEGFADCLEECHIFDNDFKRQDAIKLLVGNKEEEDPETPQNSLNRAEFMEGLLRVALFKTSIKRAGDVQADLVGKFYKRKYVNLVRKISKGIYFRIC